MAPTGIQDGTGRATSCSADSRDPPHFRFCGSQLTSPHFRFHGCQVTRSHFRYGGCHVNRAHFRFGGTHVICPCFWFGDSHVTSPSIPVRRDSHDPPPGCQVTWTHFRYGGCHMTPPSGQVTLPRHTRDPPRPTQVVPTRLIKHRAKMAPIRPQDGAGGPTSGLAGSGDPPPLPVQQESHNPAPLPVW